MVKIEKIWMTEDAVWLRTEDGMEACEYFNDYPRLKYASSAQRNNYEVDSYGIHWPEIDEDLCFAGFFSKKEKNILYRLFMSHPELNASAVARRLGISQSLFAQYINGTKKPSETRMRHILNTIRDIGKELISDVE